MRAHLIAAFYALVWVAAFFGIQALVSDQVQIDKQDVVASCLPSDQGEKAVLWLDVNSMGGLSLNCEKHVVLAYGMASVPVSKD